ncbi:Cyclopropane-fatty-acyl-phospholipid synthase [Granulibacter bethesdensis]|uniref:Cyclopropane-fatty-acyl-phospholipid synthase n=1 Tax=Granulibacter bethesdensis TaxID=364410 RepID=A0AAC9K9W0_9PROT|nr:Cyclopropane-fatty-acyl-phospholipid synthase [Granulibacter bethesdensis]APH62288.1 Cyclopropane-fatty-acyl-phospholipid synthase [Granulibacter bethesdensis]
MHVPRIHWLLDRILTRIVRTGHLEVRFSDGEIRQYGAGSSPSASMVLRSPQAERRLTLNPMLAMGELYMEGELETQGCTIYDLLNVLTRDCLDIGQPLIIRQLNMLRQARKRLDQFNPAGRSRRNVAHHYDLDGRLYAQFLDQDRQYSCAYFPTGQETLEEAQSLKKRHIAAKLKLDRPDLDVLEIGSGWGGMALYLARHHGARVTGLTLSTEQLDVSRQRAAEAGLSDRVRFELMDYRAWRQPADRIVSVGMFEHVGIGHYQTFFETVRDRLRPDGIALIHAIGRADGPGATNPWIAKYIFPGGYSPALSEVLPAVEKSGLWTTDIEILRLHYALTLSHWRQRFQEARPTITSLYDERFSRMFEFYLAGCELAFRNMGHIVWQLQVSKSLTALPLTRDYMFEAERQAEG